MSDRRFTIQSEPRGASTMKPILPHEEPRTPLVNASTTAGETSTSNLGDRRQSVSVFRRLSMSMGNSRKSSMTANPHSNRPNTYKMEPDNEHRFRPYRLQPKIHEVLVEQLKGQTYDPATINELVTKVSRSVHQVTRNFPMPRYKLVVVTSIGQKLEQLVHIASRCLWDPKTDNMVSVNYETKELMAVVTVYGFYCE